jgi:hypothetical protein
MGRVGLGGSRITSMDRPGTETTDTLPNHSRRPAPGVSASRQEDQQRLSPVATSIADWAPSGYVSN